MIELLVKGGPLMWPIMGCGIVSLILIVERTGVYMVNLRPEEHLFKRLLSALEQHDLNEALRVCRAARGIRLTLIRRFLECEVARPGRKDLSVIRQEMNEQLQNYVIPLLSARLGILSTLGRVLPLLGLLGTVQGMIDMFVVAGISGTGMSSGMAAGIGIALITTFSGLCIAIPIQLTEGILESRIESLIPKLQTDLSLLLGYIRENRFAGKVIRIRSEDVKL